MIEPTDEQFMAFVEVMVAKHRHTPEMHYGNPDEGLRTVVQTVAADTYLMLTGRVPLEVWLAEEGDPVAV